MVVSQLNVFAIKEVIASTQLMKQAVVMLSQLLDNMHIYTVGDFIHPRKTTEATDNTIQSQKALRSIVHLIVLISKLNAYFVLEMLKLMQKKGLRHLSREKF